jgi:alpha-methylacyl-CoA racemase
VKKNRITESLRKKQAGGKNHLPLRRIRVVTLAVNAPAPTAAARLAELGAQVVKVEPPAGDPMQHYCPGWYRELNRNQKILMLNLKQPRDRARLDRLLEKSDLLLTASRPAALERLALDWRRLHKRFPALCHAALVGHPAPRQHIAGHDLTYMAEAGLLVPPHMPPSVFADLAAAERMVGVALALLIGRGRSGKGLYGEISIGGAAHDLAAPLRHGVSSPGGPFSGVSPRYNLYRARDGWVAVAALEPHFWERLLAELKLKVGTKKELSAAFRKRTATAWQHWAAERDLPIAAVQAPR